MLVRPMLLHHMSLVSFLLFCKNLGNLQEFFGQMVYRPPWPKIAHTPMLLLGTNINHKGLQRTANEYAEERRIYKELISKTEK